MSMHCVLDSTRQVSWQGQLPEGDTTSANLFNELVEPWNMMDWRPFSLRHPGLLTATDSPQPSEHALSLQNCAHKSKSLVVTLPCSAKVAAREDGGAGADLEGCSESGDQKSGRKHDV
jgi:hypothetical protein